MAYSLPRSRRSVTPLSREAAIRHAGGHGFSYDGKEFVPHTALPHKETALHTLLPQQQAIMLAIALALIVWFAVDWHLASVILLSFVTIVYFIDLVFTTFLIFSGMFGRVAREIPQAMIDEMPRSAWPAYTVLCPLYKEWQVVPQFVAAMTALEYPREKLQIILLLEEDDLETIEKVQAFDLPDQFEVVVVPHSLPKTKPKAMNFGLRQARGEYLVIYDAEDVPEPLQLKKAALAFRHAGERTACIQAKLNFYNPRQNILTRVFTAEYSLWFDLVLPGLQSIDAPIPLGGTSNHFRISILRDLDGWDPFNVTEDCDLGMRLSKRGYRTEIVESTTYEEANSNVRNWYNQRSRWIKGYIQTYLVHMREPGAFVQTGRRRNVIAFQLVVGAKIFSMFANPLMWAITIVYFTLHATYGPLIESFFPTPILYIGFFCLVFGNFLYLYNYMIGCAKRGDDDLLKYVYLVPLYWLGMSVAAWKALYEIFVKPHYWSKTVHGLHLTPLTSHLEAAGQDEDIREGIPVSAEMN